MKELPEGWEWIALKDLSVEFINGGTPSTKVKSYWHGTIPWITSASINSITIEDSTEYISNEAIKDTSANIIPRGNLLFVTRVGIGKVAVNAIDCSFSQDITGILLKKNMVLPEFVARFIQSPKIGMLLKSWARGATIKGLQRDQIEDLLVPVPPLDTQRKIVAILDKAEEVRRLRAGANELTQKLSESVFLEMFGDPGLNRKGFPMISIEYACEEITVGVVVKPASYYRESGIPAFRSLNVKPNRLVDDSLVFFDSKDNDDTLKKSKLNEGDVLVVRTGYPGTACVVPERFHGTNCIDLIILRPKASLINSHFLSYLINSPYGKAQALAGNTGLAQQHLNVKRLRNILMPLPPIELQNRFAGAVEHTEQTAQQQIASYEMANSLLQGLISKAFAGELVA